MPDHRSLPSRLGRTVAAFLLPAALALAWGCASSGQGGDDGAQRSGAVKPAESQQQSGHRRRVMLYTKREELDTPLPRAASVIVRASGPVSIIEGDLETILVRARISALSEERLALASVSVAPDERGRLVIEARWPEGGRQPDEVAAFEVRLPRGSHGLEVEAVGAATLSGVSCDALVRTVNGAVTVTDHRAGVHASTTNGQMSFERVAGPIKAETTNGIVLVREASGPVSAQTTKAAIDIRLALDATGPVRAVTTQGVVSLRVGPAFAGTLTLRTSDAPIAVDAPSGRARVVQRRIDETVLDFGEGGLPSVVETSGAAIEVRAVER
jgi:hypothetical protein